MGDRSRQKDTRQLADSKYQQTCTSKLIQFLTENHYPSQISPKFLKSPSKQDVIKVFEVNSIYYYINFRLMHANVG